VGEWHKMDAGCCRSTLEKSELRRTKYEEEQGAHGHAECREELFARRKWVMSDCSKLNSYYGINPGGIVCFN
jgi:hypothetical protein